VASERPGMGCAGHGVNAGSHRLPLEDGIDSGRIPRLA